MRNQVLFVLPCRERFEHIDAALEAIGLEPCVAYFESAAKADIRQLNSWVEKTCPNIGLIVWPGLSFIDVWASDEHVRRRGRVTEFISGICERASISALQMNCDWGGAWDDEVVYEGSADELTAEIADAVRETERRCMPRFRVERFQKTYYRQPYSIKKGLLLPYGAIGQGQSLFLTPAVDPSPLDDGLLNIPVIVASPVSRRLPDGYLRTGIAARCERIGTDKSIHLPAQHLKFLLGSRLWRRPNKKMRLTIIGRGKYFILAAGPQYEALLETRLRRLTTELAILSATITAGGRE